MQKNHRMLSLAELQRRLLPFCKKHRIRRLELFGSAARGQGRPDSDADLLVTLDESLPASTGDLLEMAGEAEELVGAPADFVLRPSLDTDPQTALLASIFSPLRSAFMEADQLGRLRDILEASRLIASYVKDTTETDFRTDTQKQDAVIRRIEIIGEATAHLNEETRRAVPELPFRKMRGMRNIVAHD